MYVFRINVRFIDCALCCLHVLVVCVFMGEFSADDSVHGLISEIASYLFI